jgi:hypothetical protein
MPLGHIAMLHMPPVTNDMLDMHTAVLGSRADRSKRTETVCMAILGSRAEQGKRMEVMEALVARRQEHGGGHCNHTAMHGGWEVVVLAIVLGEQQVKSKHIQITYISGDIIDEEWSSGGGIIAWVVGS